MFIKPEYPNIYHGQVLYGIITNTQVNLPHILQYHTSLQIYFGVVSFTIHLLNERCVHISRILLKQSF